MMIVVRNSPRLPELALVAPPLADCLPWLTYLAHRSPSQQAYAVVGGGGGSRARGSRGGSRRARAAARPPVLRPLCLCCRMLGRSRSGLTSARRVIQAA
jgi:hypothetical protein